MATPIVTLTTDWGDGGFFAGKLKGLLCNLVDDIRIVDITHRLEPYNVLTATFVVREGCLAFPPGTVHIIDVATQQPFLCIKAHGQYYLCCDNGIPSMVFGTDIEECVTLAAQEGGVYNFAAYSVFAPAAARLFHGAALHDLGEPFPQLTPRNMPRFMQQGTDGNTYRIYVHYIDNYGNAYLSMTYREFEELRQGRPFVLSVRDQDVTELMTGYYQQHASADPRRRLRLTVSATGLLELAVKESSLAQLVGLRVNESVLLRFK